MAFFKCMRFVCLLVVVPSEHVAHGHSIPQCGSDGTLNATETQSITLTCTGITDNETFWDLPRSNRSGHLIARCTWPTSPCPVYNSSWYEVSRTQYGTSTLTVTHTTRDSIAGSVRCGGGNDSSKAASCIVRVVPTKKTSPTTPNKTTATTASTIPAVTSVTQDDNNDNDEDDHNDDENNQTSVIGGVVAGVVFLVIIAVVIAIVVWKKICDSTYTRPTRRRQVIDTYIYTGLDPQQQDNDDQAPEEDLYEDTTGQQPAGHGTVEYVNTATGTQAAEGTLYVEAYSSF